jgi:uncharacterized membrane protein
MDEKQRAVEQVLKIVREHGLTVADIEAAMSARAHGKTGASSSLLGRILGYLGGTFIFAGLCIFIALNWESMNTAGRIIITLGSGLALFVMALVASTDERYQRVKTPLFLIAAAIQPVGIMVAIDELSTGDDWHYASLLTAGVMFCQQFAVFWKKRETALLFTSIFFATWFLVAWFDLLGMDEELIAVLMGLSMIGLCIGLDKTSHGSITPFWYLLGSGSFYTGLFELLENSAFEVLFLAVACGGVFLSTWARSRMLLFVSTLSILAYISYFTAEHFQDSLGWPLMLILLGLLLIALSALAIRISKRYIRGA